MFKKIVLVSIILFIKVSIMASEIEHKEPELPVCIPTLEKSEDMAITVGKGENKMYVFVDPYCKYSKQFIKKITQDKSLKDSYTYKIFLLKLDKLDSTNAIEYIYSANNKLNALLEVVNDGIEGKCTKKKKYSFNRQNLGKVKHMISKLKQLDERLDIYKRPYIVVANKDWEQEWKDDHEFDEE